MINNYTNSEIVNNGINHIVINKFLLNGFL